MIKEFQVNEDLNHTKIPEMELFIIFFFFGILKNEKRM